MELYILSSLPFTEVQYDKKHKEQVESADSAAKKLKEQKQAESDAKKLKEQELKEQKKAELDAKKLQAQKQAESAAKKLKEQKQAESDAKKLKEQKQAEADAKKLKEQELKDQKKAESDAKKLKQAEADAKKIKEQNKQLEEEEKRSLKLNEKLQKLVHRVLAHRRSITFRDVRNQILLERKALAEQLKQKHRDTAVVECRLTAENANLLEHIMDIKLTVSLRESCTAFSRILQIPAPFVIQNILGHGTTGIVLETSPNEVVSETMVAKLCYIHPRQKYLAYNRHHREHRMHSTTENEFQYEIDMQTVAHAFCKKTQSMYANITKAALPLVLPTLIAPGIKTNTIIKTSGSRNIGFILMQRIARAVDVDSLLRDSTQTSAVKIKVCATIGTSLAMWHQGAMAHGDFHALNLMIDTSTRPPTVFFLDFARTCALDNLERNDKLRIFQYDLCMFIRSIRSSQSPNYQRNNSNLSEQRQLTLAFLNAYGTFTCRVHKCQWMMYKNPTDVDSALKALLTEKNITLTSINDNLIQKLYDDFRENFFTDIVAKHGTRLRGPSPSLLQVHVR
jgi:tRNA A-37 threonylcarbamoyl transferase component Bud32